MDMATPGWATSDRAAGVAWRVVSVGGGGVISLLILFGIARAQRTTLPEPVSPQEELRALVWESPPPPPPAATAPIEPPPPQSIELTPEPATGGITLSASVQPLAPPVPKFAAIRFETDLQDFAPTAVVSQGEGQRVYRVAEVDRRPMAVYRVAPVYYTAALAAVENPFVELLFIVNPHGRAEDIQVLHAPTADLGAAAVEAVREWKFRAAMRGGKAVRCLVQQTILLRVPHQSPFSR